MSDIFGRLDAVTGELYEIGRRPAVYADDVPLSQMPTSFGPWAYDAGTQTAVASAGLLAAHARAAAQALLDRAKDGLADLLRAVVLALVAELNDLRQRDRDRSADVAAATSLADLKTRWALRPALADRTGAQARATIAARLSDGSADA